MRSIFIKSIMVPGMVAGTVFPLSAIASTKTPSIDNRALAKTPDNKSNNVLTNINEGGTKRYVVIDDSQSVSKVTSTLTEFTTETLISDIKFNLWTEDTRYHVVGIEKVVMRGQTLEEGTDYTFNTNRYEFQLLENELTKNLYSIYVFPKVEAKIYPCAVSGNIGDDRKVSELLDFEVFGKVWVAESFTVRMNFNSDAWAEGWSFTSLPEEETQIEVWTWNDSGKLSPEYYEYTFDPTSRYADVTFKADAPIFQYVMICPKNLVIGHPRPDLDKRFNLTIYAEGTKLQTIEEVITYDDKEPQFALSIGQIDPDNSRKFDIYNTDEDFVKMNIGTEDEPKWERLIKDTSYTFDTSKRIIKFNLNNFDKLGNIKLDLDIQLKSGTPQQAFANDSWKEIDTLEQFFSNDLEKEPTHDNSDGFARTYNLNHLSDFVVRDYKNPSLTGFTKQVIYSSGVTKGLRVAHTFRVVSVNQMPLIEELDPNDNNIVKTISDKKAYFTFMSDNVLSDPDTDDELESTGSGSGYPGTYCVVPREFESYVAWRDRNANCWYRDVSPDFHKKSCELRLWMQDTLMKRFKSEDNGNLSTYIKCVANRTITESKDKTENFPQKYIKDTLFIPTVTQLGFKYNPKFSSSWSYMMEKDIDGDRVFQMYKGNNYSEDGAPELQRKVLTWSSRDGWGWHTLRYWLATPASNDPSGANIEDVAVISGRDYDASFTAGCLYSRDYDINGFGIVPCFCI